MDTNSIRFNHGRTQAIIIRGGHIGEVKNHWSWKNSCPLPLSLSHRQLGRRSAICDHRPAGTCQPVPLQMKSSKVPLVVIMFLYAINVGALMSLQAPFYPLEAQKKGATPAEVRYYLRSFKKSMIYELMKTCYSLCFEVWFLVRHHQFGSLHCVTN